MLTGRGAAVRMAADGLGAASAGRPVLAAWTPKTKRGREIEMLLALAVLLLVIAIVGGITIHPLLFLLALVAVLRVCRQPTHCLKGGIDGSCSQKVLPK